MSETDLLDKRVSVVEQEIEGEKLVTRHVLEQTRKNSDDLATIKSDVRALRSDVDGLRRDVNGLRHEVDALRHQVGDLRRDFPGIVAGTLREVLGERGR